MTTEPSVSERIIPILDAFSAKFHENFSGEHRLASPLGAWCLLAFIAAKDKNPSPAVTENLGCSTKEAKKLLRALLKEKPADVSFAVNSWLNPSVAGSPSLISWLKDVNKIATPDISIPTQKELNSWANENSDGAIPEFPVEIDPELFLALFTNVVSTEITWSVPLKADKNEAMAKAWGVPLFLIDDVTNNSYIHHDAVYGNFGVHCGSSKESDLTVYSVIALDEAVSETDTMAVARSIASGNTNPVALADLPLGKTSNGVLSVKEVASRWAGEDDSIKTYLPAWKSSNEFNLLDTDLGFKEAMARFNDFANEVNIKVEDLDVKVAQVTTAEYGALGFKAAALAYGWSAMRSASFGEVKSHKVEIQFNRPYAVVTSSCVYGKKWKGVPVFDGWITEANSIEARRRGGGRI